MWQKFQNIWHPDRYHGTGMKRPFFEGWYYKLVCPQKNHVYAIIPGIFFDKENIQSHAFVQFLDAEFHRTLYHRFEVDQFQADCNIFDLKIGENHFNKNLISLSLSSEGRRINGVLKFSAHNPWPVSFFSPGAMGWYAFMPFMECYHGILSFDHRIDGHLIIDNLTVDFTGGRGYMEKDWGISFPRAYIWMQSNHFEESGISLCISVAQIPWLGSAFRGFLAGFLFKGYLYRFTTYTGAQIENLVIRENVVQLVIRDEKNTIEVNASRPEGGMLYAPDGQNFFQHVTETLKSKIELRFLERDKIVFEGNGFPAGLEINGKTDFLE